MKEVKPMKLFPVFLGFCFFFNPTFAAIDVLPDFLGCIVIFLGLSRVSLVSSEMAEAKRAFLKLIPIDIAKNIALLVTMGGGNNAERPTGILLVAFAAAVVELMFFIPAVRHLFDGIEMLAMSHNATELYTARVGRFSLTECVGRLTVIFLIAREVICLLPEFTALTTSSYTDGWDRLYDFVGALRIIAAFIVLVFGVFWLVSVFVFYRKLCAEREMLTALNTAYQTYWESHPGLAIERRHAIAFLLMVIGGALLTDFYLDFKNVIPDAVGAAFLLVGALLPKVDKKPRIIVAVLAAAYGVLSIFSGRAAYTLAYEYSVGEIAKNAEANAAYTTLWVLSLIEFIVFLGLLVSLLLLLRAVVIKWAGYRPRHDANGFEDRCQKELLSELDGKLLRLFIFGFISGLFSFLYDYIKEKPGKGIYHLLEFTWVFDFCGSVVFAVMLGATLSAIYGEIKNRFLYD